MCSSPTEIANKRSGWLSACVRMRTNVELMRQFMSQFASGAVYSRLGSIEPIVPSGATPTVQIILPFSNSAR